MPIIILIDDFFSTIMCPYIDCTYFRIQLLPSVPRKQYYVHDFLRDNRKHNSVQRKNVKQLITISYCLRTGTNNGSWWGKEKVRISINYILCSTRRTPSVTNCTANNRVKNDSNVRNKDGVEKPFWKSLDFWIFITFTRGRSRVVIFNSLVEVNK